MLSPWKTTRDQSYTRKIKESSVSGWRWASWKCLFWVILLQRNAHGSTGIVQPFREQGPTSQRRLITLSWLHTKVRTLNTHIVNKYRLIGSATLLGSKQWFNSRWAVFIWFLTSDPADESCGPFSPPSVRAGQTARSHVSSSVHYSHPFLGSEAITGNVSRLITYSTET